MKPEGKPNRSMDGIKMFTIPHSPWSLVLKIYEGEAIAPVFLQWDALVVSGVFRVVSLEMVRASGTISRRKGQGDAVGLGWAFSAPLEGRLELTGREAL
jgi:hypothetical protein